MGVRMYTPQLLSSHSHKNNKKSLAHKTLGTLASSFYNFFTNSLLHNRDHADVCNYADNAIEALF